MLSGATAFKLSGPQPVLQGYPDLPLGYPGPPPAPCRSGKELSRPGPGRFWLQGWGFVKRFVLASLWPSLWVREALSPPPPLCPNGLFKVHAFCVASLRWFVRGFVSLGHQPRQSARDVPSFRFVYFHIFKFWLSFGLR